MKTYMLFRRWHVVSHQELVNEMNAHKSARRALQLLQERQQRALNASEHPAYKDAKVVDVMRAYLLGLLDN